MAQALRPAAGAVLLVASVMSAWAPDKLEIAISVLWRAFWMDWSLASEFWALVVSIALLVAGWLTFARRRHAVALVLGLVACAVSAQRLSLLPPG